jgi:hypothetical protein
MPAFETRTSIEPKAAAADLRPRLPLLRSNSDRGFLIAQFACRLRDFGRIEIGDDNAAVGFDVAFGDRVSDAACSPSDQGNFAVELRDAYSLKGPRG